MNNPTYNTIGKTYDATRCADPNIAAKLFELLELKPGNHCLDVACGSGNYTAALSHFGLNMTGIDVSEEMLTKARAKHPQVQWTHGDARELPFENNQFSGVVCTLATHHIPNLEKAFSEVHRVMNKGNFVIFTMTPQQMQHYWLHHYFPTLMEKSDKPMKNFDELSSLLTQAGFSTVRFEPFFVTHELQDLFLGSGKYKPEIYLNPTVRDNISSFRLFAHSEEITTGLAKLEDDIKTGKIKKIIADSENSLGDCLWVVASKN